MDIADMDELERRLATDNRSGGRRLGRGESDIVWGHIGERAEAEEGVAEQCRGMRTYGHFPDIMCKNRAFEGHSALTNIIIIGLDMKLIERCKFGVISTYS
jgi:hypothetical protein